MCLTKAQVMPNQTSSNHALLTMISRCLSGQWLIDATWLFQHADLLARAERGEDMSSVWPKMAAGLMQSADGLFAAADSEQKLGKGQALGVINVTGAIYKYGWNSSKSLMTYLNMMAADDRVGGVKLIVDSPGGMVHGTREVYQAVLNFPKPVLAVVDGYMASAAYYLSAGASSIVATQPNDQIGSIGTYQTFADWNALYESFGLKLYDLYATDSSQKNEEYRQVIDSNGKETALAQKQISAYNDLFLADVKAGRGAKLTGKGQDPLKGRLFFPSDGIENGLIDDLVPEAETLSFLADMVATNKQSTIQMGKLEQIMAIIGGDGAESTAAVEQLTAQVATLTAERDTAQAQVATLTSERDAAQANVTTLTTERDTLATQVSTLTTERDDAQALATQYGALPGEKPTKALKSEDKIPNAEGETKSAAEIIADLPSEKEAAAMGFQ